MRRSSLVLAVIGFALVGCRPAGTHHRFEETDYGTVWHACLAVANREQGSTSNETNRFGRTVFRSGANRAEGKIRFVSGETLIFGHIENTFELRHAGPWTVDLWIRSLDRTSFLPGTTRVLDKEAELLKAVKAELAPGGGMPFVPALAVAVSCSYTGSPTVNIVVLQRRIWPEALG